MADVAEAQPRQTVAFRDGESEPDVNEDVPAAPDAQPPAEEGAPQTEPPADGAGGGAEPEKLGQTKGKFIIGSTKTTRKLEEMLDDDVMQAPDPNLPPEERYQQPVPDIDPIEHRYDDAVEQVSMLKTRVKLLESKIEQVSSNQEGSEKELIDVVSACKMVLNGILTEGDFKERIEEVEMVRSETAKLFELLRRSQSVRDIEVKVVFFGPDLPLRKELISLLGADGSKNSTETFELSHLRTKGSQFTFWNVMGDARHIEQAVWEQALALSSALVLLVSAPMPAEDLDALRNKLRAVLALETGRVPLAVLVAKDPRKPVSDNYEAEVAEGLGLAHVWQRMWKCFPVEKPEDGMRALLWLRENFPDQDAPQRQAEFAIDSINRQAELVADLKNRLLPSVAEKYREAQERADNASTELQAIDAAKGDIVPGQKAQASEDNRAPAAGETMAMPTPTMAPSDQRPKFGSALEMLEAGGFYEGTFRYWRRDGPGILVDQMRGEVYQGQFRNDRCHGTGTKTWTDGTQYAGSWNNGLKHGGGKLLSADGRKYDGQWSEGQRHGRGVQVFENKDRYFGQWRDGQQHGKGKYHFHAEDGKWDFEGLKYNATFDGAWVRGCYHGSGKLYRTGLPTEELEYDNGVLVSRTTLTDGDQTRAGMHAAVQYPALEPTPYRVSETTRVATFAMTQPKR
jgi:hypothetical protein